MNQAQKAAQDFPNLLAPLTIASRTLRNRGNHGLNAYAA